MNHQIQFNWCLKWFFMNYELSYFNCLLSFFTRYWYYIWGSNRQNLALITLIYNTNFYSWYPFYHQKIHFKYQIVILNIDSFMQCLSYTMPYTISSYGFDNLNVCLETLQLQLLHFYLFDVFFLFTPNQFIFVYLKI